MTKRTPPARRRKARTAYLLTQGHFAIRARIDSALRELGVTSLQYTVLSMVSHHPGSSSADLSRRFYRTQQAMGQVLSGLVERGWAVRSEDPANRRILRVALTEEGKTLVRTGDQLMDRIEQTFFAGFSSEETDTFRRVLEAVIALGSEEDVPASPETIA